MTLGPLICANISISISIPSQTASRPNSVLHGEVENKALFQNLQNIPLTHFCFTSTPLLFLGWEWETDDTLLKAVVQSYLL